MSSTSIKHMIGLVSLSYGIPPTTPYCVIRTMHAAMAAKSKMLSFEIEDTVRCTDACCTPRLIPSQDPFQNLGTWDLEPGIT